jgi:hypothetical protein
MSFVLLAAVRADDDHGDSRVREGFRIAPVHLNVKGKNVEQVGLGSYLVNAVGGCNDCHTCPSYAPGHDPYGRILQVMPWPVFRNMTDSDLHAIYQYLSAIPHAEPGQCVAPGQ